MTLEFLPTSNSWACKCTIRKVWIYAMSHTTDAVIESHCEPHNAWFRTYSKYLPASTWRYLYMTNGNSVISRVWCEMNMRRFSKLTLPVSVNGSSWQVKPGSLLEDLSTARLVSLWCSWHDHSTVWMSFQLELCCYPPDSSKYGTKKVANARQRLPKVRL